MIRLGVGHFRPSAFDKRHLAAKALSLQPLHDSGQAVASGVQAKAQPFRIEAMSLVRDRPLPQNDFELRRSGRRDISIGSFPVYGINFFIP